MITAWREPCTTSSHGQECSCRCSDRRGSGRGGHLGDGSSDDVAAGPAVRASHEARESGAPTIDPAASRGSLGDGHRCRRDLRCAQKSRARDARRIRTRIRHRIFSSRRRSGASGARFRGTSASISVANARSRTRRSPRSWCCFGSAVRHHRRCSVTVPQRRKRDWPRPATKLCKLHIMLCIRVVENCGKPLKM